jgi:tetratricopeptide (TPR) repeat protein
MAKGSTARARERTAPKASEDRARTQALKATARLFDKATALYRRGQADEAIAAYDSLVARIGSTDDLDLLALIADALFNKGVILQQSLQRPGAAMEAYDALLARFDTAKEPPLMEAVAKTLQNKGFLLYSLGRRAEAIKVCDELEERFGSTTATDSVLGRIVASNRITRNSAFCDELVEHFDKIPSPTLDERVTVATALIDRGVSFSEFPGGNETAIVNYDMAMERFGNADELPLQVGVIRALLNKATALHGLDRREEEIASFDEISARFGKSDEPVLREQVIWALTLKGDRLSDSQRHEEAVEVFDQALVRLGGISEPSLVDRRTHVLALSGKARTLGLLGRRDEEIAAYDGLAVFAADPDPDLRKEVAACYFIKGGVLEDDGRLQEAIAAYQKGLSLEPDDDAAARSLERTRARFDELQAEQGVTPQESPEQKIVN